MNHLQNAQIGDVFAYYLERYGVYCPCQVIYANENSVAMVFFNHFSAEIPSLDSVQQSSILLKNHHSWNGDKFAFCVERDENVQFHFIEHSDIIMSVGKQDVQENDDFSQIDFQYAWQQLPPFIQDHYHAMGQILPQYQHIAEYANLNLSQLSRATIHLIENKTLSELREIKEKYYFSSSIQSQFFNDDLRAFLMENPLITSFTFLQNVPKEVDISDTYLNHLMINISGVEKLILNRAMHNLNLMGDFSDLKEIICPFDGRLLHLSLSPYTQNVVHFLGLTSVQYLRFDVHQSLDINFLKNKFINIQHLEIKEYGYGGRIENIMMLKDFNVLKGLSIDNCYDFDEFPLLLDLPHLQKLHIKSIPKNIGDKIKKSFKSVHELKISQLRNEEWIQTHFKNPFKDWENKPNIPHSKAMKAYADAYKKLSKDTLSQDEQLAILQEFLQIFQAIDKKWHLDTLEREEVYSAYKMLVALTNIEQKSVERLFENIIC